MKVIISWSNLKTHVGTIDRIYDPSKDGIAFIFDNEDDKLSFIDGLKRMRTGDLGGLACPKDWKLSHAKKALKMSKKAAAVSKAREAGVCRVCGEKRDDDHLQFTLDYGREFAHDKCLIEEEKQKKTKRTSRKSK